MAKGQGSAVWHQLCGRRIALRPNTVFLILAPRLGLLESLTGNTTMLATYSYLLATNNTYG